MLAVLATDMDVVASHLAAGQALDRVLLTASAYELHASFLNQPIEVAQLRPHVAAFIGKGHPQLILRLGYGHQVKATPRRSVGEVLTHNPDRVSNEEKTPC